jgi:amino acid transporter/nucleotide-binding universal stress UspA family protein
VTDNQVAAADKAPAGELSRELSLFHITMMGLGMMIGAGVFLGVGNAIFVAGPGGVILTFALNGLIAIFTAMSYAELSSAIPRAGGAYNFARLAFGRPSSFLAGWMEWFASSVAGSLYAVTFAIYTVLYLDKLKLLTWLPIEIAFLEKIVAVLIAAFFIYINYRGASETGKVGAFFTLGQTLFLAFIGIVGIIKAARDPSLLQNFMPFVPHGWSKLLVTMGFTYVAFEGFEVIAQTGDEAIDPKRNLPKAMLYSVLIVTLTYVAVSFATIVAVKAGSPGVDMPPWQWIGQFREKGFGHAVAQLMPFANLLLTLAVIFASTSALNATIYSATRASYALGRDRMLSPVFAKISKKQNTPYIALLGTGCIVIIVASCLPTMDVASSASIMFLFLFFMVNLCVIKIRRSMADELTYGFMMPLFPIFPILAIICQVFLAVWLVHMSLIAWIIAPAWIILGIIIYYAYSKSHAITTEGEILVLEEKEQLYSDRYRVMVAVANPTNATELVQSTYRLCGAKDAQVELLHMVPVPDLVSLTDAGKYTQPGKEALIEVMLYLSMHFPISTTLRYCRNIARGIVSAIREKKTEMLVLGWHGRPPTHIFNLGATVDPVIEQAPCNVVILKDCGGNKVFKNTLVPITGGPNSPFALEIASILTEQEDGQGSGKITAFTVDTGRHPFDLDQFLDEQTDRLNLGRNRFIAKTVKAKRPLLAILKEARNYDLVVIGTIQKPLIFQLARQSIPEKIACRCAKPTVMVKGDLGVRSWIRRWI